MAILPQQVQRVVLVERAFRLEILTIGWMSIEAAVSLGAGVASSSLTLITFGADSVIELVSAAVLLWRLTVELRRGASFPESIERRAAKIGGSLLVALILYVLTSACWSLWRGEGQEFSIAGITLAIVAIPIMYALAKAKLKIADQIESRALRVDAVESIACGYLSVIVVLGLLAQLFVSAWWIDGVSALAFVPFLWREAREAWQGDDCCE